MDSQKKWCGNVIGCCGGLWRVLVLHPFVRHVGFFDCVFCFFSLFILLSLIFVQKGGMDGLLTFEDQNAFARPYYYTATHLRTPVASRRPFSRPLAIDILRNSGT